MSRLYTAILARNEASGNKYLRRVLERCREFSDSVLFLDDRSTDQTPQIARDHGCIVKTRPARMPEAWGNESPARKELWDFALEYATEPDDWVLICDADMEMRGNIRDLCQSREVNSWSFVLYDLWSETEYREDGFWQGHLYHRPWLFAPRRVPEGFKPEWPAKGLHTGHCPPNMPLISGLAPQNEYFWLHWAYASPRLRAEKHRQYLSKEHLLSPFEVAHARSIISLDPAP